MRDTLVGEAELFRPDILLPSQFFGTMRHRVPQEAEYRLVVALLQDAVECFQKHVRARDPKSRQLFTDAEEWINSEDRAWAFSFINVCDLLGLNGVHLRRGLQLWKERELAAHRRRTLCAVTQPDTEPGRSNRATA